MRHAGIAVAALVVAVAAEGAPAGAASGSIRAGRAVRPAPQRLELSVTAQAMQGVEFPTTVRTLVGKAQPDECFVAPGDPGNVYPASPPCALGVPKVNQGYAWSMAEAGGDIWFGTIANPLCAVIGGFLGVGSDIQTDSFACALSGGPLADLRPPQIWLHRPPPAGTLENKTPVSPLVAATSGMRAAGAHRAAGDADAVVLIGGPRLSPAAGLNLFAFNATTRAFIGAATVGGMAPPQPADYTVYNDIRSFLLANGELYAGVRYEVRDMATGAAKERGGKILRWTGSLASPFSFVEVGTLDTEAAYLAYHEGRLFVSTWPVADPQDPDPFPDNMVLAGVWMSPDFGGDGVLDAADGAFTRVWGVESYEPDPLIVATYAGGAIASFGDGLYWGTMHVPFLATRAHFEVHSAFYDSLPDGSPEQAAAVLAALVGTQRAIKVFRGEDLASGTPAIELLYGLPAEPVFDGGTGSWSLVANAMGGANPRFGISGFGNLFNNYTWAMRVHGGRLWVGTMDWSYLVYDFASTALQEVLGEELELPPDALPPLLQEYFECVRDAGTVATVFGGDLHYFPEDGRPAYPESISGIGNYTSYGVRNLVSAPSGLYAGMANPMNLLTDTTDDVPEGGWEVIRLADLPHNTPAGNPVQVTLPDGSRVTFCGVDEPGYTVGAWVPTPCCGLWMPVPPNYRAPERMLILGSSAVLTTENGCSGAWPMTVCVPNPGPGLTRLLQPVANGAGMSWQDITTSSFGDLVCGELQEGSQPLLHALGYHGYLGAVVALQQNEPIPAVSGWGMAALAALMAAVGAAALRSRLG
jgi:hypothetical protein